MTPKQMREKANDIKMKHATPGGPDNRNERIYAFANFLLWLADRAEQNDKCN